MEDSTTVKTGTSQKNSSSAFHPVIPWGKMLMEWFNTHKNGHLLPVNTPSMEKSVNGIPNAQNVLKWIRRGISSATKVVEDNTETTESDSNEITDCDQDQEEKAPKPNIATVSFPSFLNSGYTSPMKYQYRRASLLDGIEQTLDVSFGGRRSLLAPPIKETSRKLNLALRNMFTNPRGKLEDNQTDLQTDEESQQALLPLPLYSFKPPKISTTSSPSTILTLIKTKSENTFHKDCERSTFRSVVSLVIVFLMSCALIGTVYNNFPEMSEEEKENVKLPRDIEDAKQLGRVLSKYKDTNYFEVMSAFFVTYIFLQTFAIPGSVFLSILSGFMYPFYIALFLVCLCSGIGASGCYLISYFIGKPLVQKYLEERVRKWNEVVDGQREHLFNYLLFLRITPFLPNWFINIVSPVIEIPVSTFFVATFIGVAPLSFIAIQAGTTLYQLTAAGDAISWTSVIVMAILAVLSLVPVLLKKTLKGKFE